MKDSDFGGKLSESHLPRLLEGGMFPVISSNPPNSHKIAIITGESVDTSSLQKSEIGL